MITQDKVYILVFTQMKLVKARAQRQEKSTHQLSEQMAKEMVESQQILNFIKLISSENLHVLDTF